MIETETRVLFADTTYKLDGTISVFFRNHDKFDYPHDITRIEKFSKRHGKLMKKVVNFNTDGSSSPLFRGSKTIWKQWVWWERLSDEEKKLRRLRQ